MRTALRRCASGTLCFASISTSYEFAKCPFENACEPQWVVGYRIARLRHLVLKLYSQTVCKTDTAFVYQIGGRLGVIRIVTGAFWSTSPKNIPYSGISPSENSAPTTRSASLVRNVSLFLLFFYDTLKRYGRLCLEIRHLQSILIYQTKISSGSQSMLTPDR